MTVNTVIPVDGGGEGQSIYVDADSPPAPSGECAVNV